MAVNHQLGHRHDDAPWESEATTTRGAELRDESFELPVNR